MTHSIKRRKKFCDDGGFFTPITVSEMNLFLRLRPIIDSGLYRTVADSDLSLYLEIPVKSDHLEVQSPLDRATD
jgi:hypothetical protein